MSLPLFKLEDYLGKYEFSAQYLLCCSDAESWSMNEIMDLADSQAQELWSTLRLGYTEVPGLPLLRKEIAALYPGLSNDEILCFAGAEDGIHCAMQTLLTDRDHVIVVTPCYQSLETLPRHLGADVTTIPLQEENGWRLDLNQVAASIRPNTKIMVINYPHNPTGQILDEQELLQLTDLLRPQGIYLFSDEVYRLLGPRETKWALPVASLYERGLSLGVMSKAYGMAGLRVGWIACQDQTLLKKIEQAKYYTSICNSAPSEVLSLMALRAGETILKRNNTILQENLALLDSFMERHAPKFSWVRPRGGCVGFVRYHGQGAVDQLAEQLVEKTGVLIMPASIYDCATNHFRIGFGRKNFPEALEMFEEFIEKKIDLR